MDIRQCTNKENFRREISHVVSRFMKLNKWFRLLLISPGYCTLGKVALMPSEGNKISP